MALGVQAMCVVSTSLMCVLRVMSSASGVGDLSSACGVDTSFVGS